MIEWGQGLYVSLFVLQMWTRSPIMQGSTEQQQITLISQLCGSITPEVWPGVEGLELYSKLELPKGQKRKVSTSTVPKGAPLCLNLSGLSTRG